MKVFLWLDEELEEQEESSRNWGSAGYGFVQQRREVRLMASVVPMMEENAWWQKHGREEYRQSDEGG